MDRLLARRLSGQPPSSFNPQAASFNPSAPSFQPKQATDSSALPGPQAFTPGSPVASRTSQNPGLGGIASTNWQDIEDYEPSPFRPAEALRPMYHAFGNKPDYKQQLFAAANIVPPPTVPSFVEEHPTPSDRGYTRYDSDREITSSPTPAAAAIAADTGTLGRRGQHADSGFDAADWRDLNAHVTRAATQTDHDLSRKHGEDNESLKSRELMRQALWKPLTPGEVAQLYSSPILSRTQNAQELTDRQALSGASTVKPEDVGQTFTRSRPQEDQPDVPPPPGFARTQMGVYNPSAFRSPAEIPGQQMPPAASQQPAHRRMSSLSSSASHFDAPRGPRNKTSQTRSRQNSMRRGGSQASRGGPRRYSRSKRSDQGPEPSSADIYPDDSLDSINASPFAEQYATFTRTAGPAIQQQPRQQYFKGEQKPDLRVEDTNAWPKPGEVNAGQRQRQNVAKKAPAHQTQAQTYASTLRPKTPIISKDKQQSIFSQRPYSSPDKKNNAGANINRNAPNIPAKEYVTPQDIPSLIATSTFPFTPHTVRHTSLRNHPNVRPPASTTAPPSSVSASLDLSLDELLESAKNDPLTCRIRSMEGDQLNGKRYGLKYWGIGLGDEWKPPGLREWRETVGRRRG